MTDTGSKLWPLAIVAVLGLTVGANGYLLMRANDVPMPLERDYYQKAVAWDSTMAQAARNVALGWQLRATVDAAGALDVVLGDASGNSITDARIAVEAFPIAFSDGEAAATLTTDNGRYRGALALPHPGLHEFRFLVTRGGDRFTTALRGALGTPLVNVP